jgi:hypothetical protein
MSTSQSAKVFKATATKVERRSYPVAETVRLRTDNWTLLSRHLAQNKRNFLDNVDVPELPPRPFKKLFVRMEKNYDELSLTIVYRMEKAS